jgi:hypothetical protein
MSEQLLTWLDKWLLDYVLAGWQCTCCMDTCDEHVLLCRSLFIPPPFSRNFMAACDDRVFTKCEHYITYTGIYVAERLWSGEPVAYGNVTLFWYFLHSDPSHSAFSALWLYVVDWWFVYGRRSGRRRS